MERKIKVSVIIPVYEVEGYIERNVRSLMNQTLLDCIEFIYIDDATPDNSINIVKSVVGQYPHRVGQVSIISHESNKGLPAARNTGLEHAKGEYVFHCDSDDFVEPDMLELMLQKAEEEDADMVWCDWFLTFGESERPMAQLQATTARAALTAMLDGSMKYNVWNKVVKRDLYISSGILFPAGRAMGEDMTMIKLAANTKKVASVSKPLYHYIRVNSGAMTQQYDEAKLLILRQNVDDTINYLRQNIADKDIEQEISWFLLNVKLPFLFTGNNADIRRWREWYTEADKHIMSNKAQPLRTRMLQLCAAHGLFAINLAYYNIVFKLIYGKIYR